MGIKKIQVVCGSPRCKMNNKNLKNEFDPKTNESNPFYGPISKKFQGTNYYKKKFYNIIVQQIYCIRKHSIFNRKCFWCIFGAF